MTQAAFVAALLSCVVGVNAACRTTEGHPGPCILTYESLSDEEAYKEVIVLGRMRIGFAQHEREVEYAQITPIEGGEVLSVLATIKNGMSEDFRSADCGEFLSIRCGRGPDLHMDLARAGESTWRALERLDAILTRHFPDYVPISKYARWVRGG